MVARLVLGSGGLLERRLRAGLFRIERRLRRLKFCGALFHPVADDLRACIHDGVQRIHRRTITAEDKRRLRPARRRGGLRCRCCDWIQPGLRGLGADGGQLLMILRGVGVECLDFIGIGETRALARKLFAPLLQAHEARIHRRLPRAIRHRKLRDRRGPFLFPRRGINQGHVAIAHEQQLARPGGPEAARGGVALQLQPDGHRDLRLAAEKIVPARAGEQSGDHCDDDQKTVAPFCGGRIGNGRFFDRDGEAHCAGFRIFAPGGSERSRGAAVLIVSTWPSENSRLPPALP